MTSSAGFLEFAEDAQEFGEGLEECAGDEMVTVGDNTAEETAEKVADDARRFAPVDTGQLRDSIFVWPMPLEPMERRIIAGTDYSRYVEYGTNPHIIPPSPITTYDEPVMHPGATAKPFLRPALWLNIRTMHSEFEDEMERLFRRKL